jgi:hypothetical protein
MRRAIALLLAAAAVTVFALWPLPVATAPTTPVAETIQRSVQIFHFMGDPIWVSVNGGATARVQLTPVAAGGYDALTFYAGAACSTKVVSLTNSGLSHKRSVFISGQAFQYQCTGMDSLIITNMGSTAYFSAWPWRR